MDAFDDGGLEQPVGSPSGRRKSYFHARQVVGSLAGIMSMMVRAVMGLRMRVVEQTQWTAVASKFVTIRGLSSPTAAIGELTCVL